MTWLLLRCLPNSSLLSRQILASNARLSAREVTFRICRSTIVSKCAFVPHHNAASSSKDENTAGQSGGKKEIDTATTYHRQYCMRISHRSI